MGNLGGFDWNGNGKRDAFDNYVDMQIINGDNSSEDAEEANPNTKNNTSYSKPIDNKELKGISMGGKPLYDASKDSNGVTVLKCFLVTALCIGGIILPVATDMGTLGTLLCIFGGLGLSVLILKNV
jgi:hypothetical protein